LRLGLLAFGQQNEVNLNSVSKSLFLFYKVKKFSQGITTMDIGSSPKNRMDA
jgi:hypothetical protein